MAVLDAQIAAAQRERDRQALEAIKVARGDMPANDVLERASRYLEHAEGGHSGEGRNPKAWSVTLRVVRGFGLAEGEAFDLLRREYAPRCRPTLPDRELRGMVRRAIHAPAPPWGYLLERAAR